MPSWDELAFDVDSELWRKAVSYELPSRDELVFDVDSEVWRKAVSYECRVVVGDVQQGVVWVDMCECVCTCMYCICV